MTKWIKPSGAIIELNDEEATQAHGLSLNWEKDVDTDPIDSMTIPELRTHAEDNEIDLGENTKKADILAIIKAAD